MGNIIVKINRDQGHLYLEDVRLALRKNNCYLGFNNWWWEEKVVPEVKSGKNKREITISWNPEERKVEGIAITKTNPSTGMTKLCTIFVIPEARGKGIGEELMGETDYADYVTVSSRLSATDQEHLFKLLVRWGFELKDIITLEGASERIFVKSLMRDYWNQKVALMSIKSEFCDKIFKDGTKLVEFRKKYNPDIKKVIVYSSGRYKMIIGAFEVFEVVEETPEELWNKFSLIGGITEEKFNEYYRGKKEGVAIVLGNLINDWIDPNSTFMSFLPPQSYMYI